MREHLPSHSGLRLVRGRKTCVSFNLSKIWEMFLQSNSELCVILHSWQVRPFSVNDLLNGTFFFKLIPTSSGNERNCFFFVK